MLVFIVIADEAKKKKGEERGKEKARLKRKKEYPWIIIIDRCANLD